MKNSSKIPRVINTDAPVKNDGKPRLPNDRDTAPDIQSLEPDEQTKRAYDDLERGLVDTDLRGQHGLDATKKVDSLLRRDKEVKKH